MLLWLLDAMYVEMASVEELVPTYVREKHQTSIVPASSFQPCWTVGFFCSFGSSSIAIIGFSAAVSISSSSFLIPRSPVFFFRGPSRSQALSRFPLSSLANLTDSNLIRYNYQHKVLVARSCVLCCLEQPSKRICIHCGVAWLRL